MRQNIWYVFVVAIALAACTPDTAQPGGVNGPGAAEEQPAYTVTGSFDQPQKHFRKNVGNTVDFAYDSAELTSEPQAVLQLQADFLLTFPASILTIEGHADERGTREYNLALGERRANAVANYLIAVGVDRARLTTISYGKERPVCVATNETCWAQNRRGVSVLQ